VFEIAVAGCVETAGVAAAATDGSATRHPTTIGPAIQRLMRTLP